MFWNRDLRRWSRTRLPHQPFAFASVPSPQWWKLERRRWFSFLAPVQNCRAYFLPAVETPAAQPPWLGSSYLFLCIKGRIGRGVRVTLRLSRRYRDPCCSCLWMEVLGIRWFHTGIEMQTVLVLLGHGLHYFWISDHQSVVQELAHTHKLVFYDVLTFPCHLFPNPHSA